MMKEEIPTEFLKIYKIKEIAEQFQPKLFIIHHYLFINWQSQLAWRSHFVLSVNHIYEKNNFILRERIVMNNEQ